MKTITQQLNVKEFPFIIKDSKGKEIYYENSEGYWAKKEFDSKGNIIYYENSEGYWFKKVYDSKGNRIYFENSKGNRIYYENSNGYIKDNRNIPELPKEDDMNILSDKKYDELVEAKRELDILHQLFMRRKGCGNIISKEAKKLGIPYDSATNAIYDVIDRYFSEIEK